MPRASRQGKCSRALWRLRFLCALRILLFAFLACAFLFAVAWYVFPFPQADLDRYPAATVLLDREGAPLRLKLGPGDTDCRPHYRPDPDHDWICKAVVAAEDRRFWHHPGVDALALARAICQDVTHRRVVSGASTLSTQVVRLMHPRRRTPWAKVVELFRALQLESLLDKRAILGQYLNRAPFGANRIGIEAASRGYFAKEPRDLSLAEAALLAGLPQSPSRLRPDRFPGRARRRGEYVLGRMLACGAITDVQRATAHAQTLALRRDTVPFRAPHFCDVVLAELGGLGVQGGPGAARTGSPAPARAAECAGHQSHTDGYRIPRQDGAIRTTLDPALQRLAEDALRRRSDALRPQGVFGGAVVAIEVRSGAVRALVGSPDYADRTHAGQVNAATALRAAGSTLKPFAYALAMDQGRLTPATVLADVPRVFKDFAPANFDGEYRGPVTAQTALTLSLNIPALTLVEQMGVDAFLHTLRTAGLNTLDRSAAHYGLNLALGDASVRLLDLANAYACFARGGQWFPYRLLENQKPESGPDRQHALAVCRRVCSPEVAWLVAEMLSGDERSADTTGHCADVRLPRIAWKTGTSAGFRDAWAVGFNPEYVVGVWIGNPDGRASPALIGARAAVPAMWELFRACYPGNDGPWFERPAGVIARSVCAVSGLPAGPHCPQTQEAWSVAGVSSARPCGMHVPRTTADGRLEVTEVWPKEVEAYLRQRVTSAAKGAARATLDAPDVPHLINPRPGATYRLVDDFASGQRLSFKVAGREGERFYWFVDDRLVATATAGDPVAWPLVRGRHVVVCANDSGAADKAEIVVECVHEGGESRQ